MKEKKATTPLTQSRVDGEDTGENKKRTWCDCAIVADADYVNGVAFNLTVNFERMLGRRIPPADLAQWAECVALDGGLREGNHEVNVVLVHDKASRQMDNFRPADYERELTGQAFRSNLGEFVLNAVSVEEMTTKEQLISDIVDVLLTQPDVKHIILIPDTDAGTVPDALRRTLQRSGGEKTITLLSMQPLAGGRFQQEILGYSLMQALGIHADELR